VVVDNLQDKQAALTATAVVVDMSETAEVPVATPVTGQAVAVLVATQDEVVMLMNGPQGVAVLLAASITRAHLAPELVAVSVSTDKAAQDKASILHGMVKTHQVVVA
jgi:hypothetical protein